MAFCFSGPNYIKMSSGSVIYQNTAKNQDNMSSFIDNYQCAKI